ncbi:MAG: phytanoyl-CoA dioxygenase family protein [Armatimonadetes bacterium]|nr:phytanoyl-CoA dioxygenase family protein [Armatimonadota bacterium]
MITTPEQRKYFRENGYLILPDLFSLEEIALTLADSERLHTQELVAEAGGRNRGGMVVEDGATARLQFDIHRTGSLFALMCRHPRVAGVMQELMGVPLYLYHSKLAFKAPFTGSVQYWHQDFGYWQSLHERSDMASCLVTLDEHTEDNACMQVLAGSHREGVVVHETAPNPATGDNQLRIPSSLMPEFCRKYARIKLIGKPGTFVAWHSNTMHASGHNISERSRRALIVAFNAVGNSDPTRVGESPFTAHSEHAVELVSEDSLLASPHSQ